MLWCGENDASKRYIRPKINAGQYSKEEKLDASFSLLATATFS